MTDRHESGRRLRAQDELDRELRAHFAAIPHPALPPDFAESCARRASAQASGYPLGRRQRVILRSYWIATALVSVGLLLGTRWPTTLPTGLAIVLGATAAAVLVPVLLLARLRGGLFSLVIRVLG